MAGERTKDLTKINITLSSSVGRRTLTSLWDWDSGEGPEKITERDPDLKGNTYLTKQEKKSRTCTIKVPVGTQDEKFLDKLALGTHAFDMNVVDNSNSLYGKQHNGVECYISKVPSDPFREGKEREYSIICSEFATKQL